MQKAPIKSLPILGLVLMAASAIAAMLPGRSGARAVNNGTLRNFSASDGPLEVLSCIPEVDTFLSCTATAITTTTNEVEGQAESTVNGLQTQGNTSVTAGVPGDQNSMLIEV